MKVLVTGGRAYGVRNDTQRLFVFQTLSALHDRHGFTEILEGGAAGADACAATFGRLKDIRVTTYKADWSEHGPAAGPIRNRKMVMEGKPDLVIAFPGGRGTADCLFHAREAGIKVIEASPVTSSDRHSNDLGKSTTD